MSATKHKSIMPSKINGDGDGDVAARDNVIREILTTERVYVHDLDVCVQVLCTHSDLS